MLNLKKFYFLSVLIVTCFVFLSACGSLGQTKEKFVVALNSPHVQVGEIETQFNTFMSFGGLKKNLVKVFYYPREDAVCLQYRREFTTYNQFWSSTGRQTFLAALVQYNSEYNERTLTVQNRKNIRVYGNVGGYLYWQMYRFTVQAKSSVKVELGYQFRDNSPYFSIHQREAEFKEEMTRDHDRTSPAITMYFTRAQASILAEMFDQETLQQALLTPTAEKELGEEEFDGERDAY